MGIETARWWRIPLTLVFVLIGWALFRAATFTDARFIIENLWHGPLGTCNWTNWHAGLFALAAATAILEERFQVEDRLIEGSALNYATAIAAMLLILEIFAVTDVAIPFVYFQF